MSQCERLSDRMPEVALGRSVWSAVERQHLDDCDDCRSEWRLVEMAARLGASRPRSASAEAISASVLDRLAVERASVSAWRRRWLAAALAAAAIAIIAVRVPRSEPPGPESSAPIPVPVASTSGQALPLPELEDLPASELESILGVLDDSSGVSRSLDDSGLDDLDNHELERALSAWEG